MSFHSVFSQLARYGEQVTVSAGAFIHESSHCVSQSVEHFILRKFDSVMQPGMRVGYFKYTIGILQG